MYVRLVDGGTTDTRPGVRGYRGEEYFGTVESYAGGGTYMVRSSGSQTSKCGLKPEHEVNMTEHRPVASYGPILRSDLGSSVRGRDKLRGRLDKEKRLREVAEENLEEAERKLKRLRQRIEKGMETAEREREKRVDAEKDLNTLMRGGGGGGALTRKGREVQETFMNTSEEVQQMRAAAKAAEAAKIKLEVELGRKGREVERSKQGEQDAVQQAEEDRAKQTVAQTRFENEERKRKAAEAALGNAKKARATAEAKSATAEAEVVRMAEELGGMDVEVDELRDELFRARSLMPKVAQAQLDMLLLESRAIDTKSTVSLIGALGKKGEMYSQDVIELGMELMEKGLTAPQVSEVE